MADDTPKTVQLDSFEGGPAFAMIEPHTGYLVVQPLSGGAARRWTHETVAAGGLDRYPQLKDLVSEFHQSGASVPASAAPGAIAYPGVDVSAIVQQAVKEALAAQAAAQAAPAPAAAAPAAHAGPTDAVSVTAGQPQAQHEAPATGA